MTHQVDVAAGEAAFDRSPVARAVVDADGLIVRTNAAWRLFMRLNDGQASGCDVGVNYLTVCADAADDGVTDGSEVGNLLRQVLTGERDQALLEYHCPAPGEDCWFLFQAVAIQIDGQQGALVTHANITDRRIRQRRLAARPDRDGLTGLPNRSAMRQALAAGPRASGARGFVGADEQVRAVRIILDGMAKVVEVFGQVIADDVVIQMSARVAGQIRGTDMLCRPADGEFLVLCSAGTDVDRPEAMAVRLCDALRPPYQTGTRVVNLRVEVDAQALPAIDRELPVTQESSGTKEEHFLILLVEDNPGDASLIKAELTDPTAAGSTASVRVATSLASALDVLAEQPIDCVLLDLGLPDSDGLDGLEILHEAWPLTPIVVLTGRSDEQLARIALRCGAQDYLVKNDVERATLQRSIRYSTERQYIATSQAQLRSLLERISDVVCIVEPDGVVRYASPSVEEFLGRPIDEVIGRNSLQFVHPDDQTKMIATIEQVLQDPSSHPTVAFRLLTADSSWRWGEVTVSNLLDDPSLRGLVVAVRDVTERQVTLTELRAAEARQAAVVEHSEDLVMFFDGDGTIQYVSPAAEQLFGVPPESIMGATGFDFIHPDDLVRAMEAFGPMSAVGDHVQVEFRIIDAAGRTRWVEETATNLLDDPRVGYVVANLRDVTDRREAMGAVEFQATLLEAAGRPIIASSTTGEILSWNRAADELYGWTADEAVGHVLPMVEADPSTIHDEVWAALRDEGRWNGEIVARRRDGSTFPAWVTCSPVERDGRVVAAISVVTDLTRRKADEAELEHQALHDPLTDLPNRTAITRQLDEVLASQRRGGPATAIAFLDLDRFKVINDSLGHAAGDRVLVAVAERLRTMLPEPCTIGRFGGDEFVVLTEVATDGLDAAGIGDRVLACLKDPVEVNGRDFYLSGSVGVTVSQPGDSHETVLRDADVAMYDAKETRQEHARVFDPIMHERTARRLDLETGLRKALDHDLLRLAYQPIIRLSDSHCVGVEALLRWEDPERGVIEPMEFIPLAEETGLILPIGDWVLEQALAQLQQWRRDGADDVFMSVNVSARQLARPSLVQQVVDGIAQAGVPPSLLHLEVTESAIMDDLEGSNETLHQLKDAGVRVSVDDFGTGYSSLAYLKRFPLDALKVDRSFVDGLGSESEDTSLVRAITSLGKALELEVIAEGVETSEQLAALVELGCDFGQGYLWSRAVPPDEAATWFVRSSDDPPARDPVL